MEIIGDHGSKVNDMRVTEHIKLFSVAEQEQSSINAQLVFCHLAAYRSRYLSFCH